MDFSNFSRGRKRRSDFRRFLADRHPGEKAEDHYVGGHIQLDRLREFVGWMICNRLTPPRHERDAWQYLVELMLTELSAVGPDVDEATGDRLVGWISVLRSLHEHLEWYDECGVKPADGKLTPIHELLHDWMSFDLFCSRDASRAWLNWSVEQREISAD